MALTGIGSLMAALDTMVVSIASTASSVSIAKGPLVTAGLRALDMRRLHTLD